MAKKNETTAEHPKRTARGGADKPVSNEGREPLSRVEEAFLSEIEEFFQSALSWDHDDTTRSTKDFRRLKALLQKITGRERVSESIILKLMTELIGQGLITPSRIISEGPLARVIVRDVQSSSTSLPGVWSYGPGSQITVKPDTPEPKKKRVFGAHKGKIAIGPEFFEPLSPEELKGWGEG